MYCGEDRRDANVRAILSLHGVFDPGGIVVVEFGDLAFLGVADVFHFFEAKFELGFTGVAE